MAEHATMREAIGAAIDKRLAEMGGGFRLSFVFAIEAVDDEGQPVMFFGGPDGQPTIRSLGLSKYLKKWYDAEARELIAGAGSSCSCEGCEDEE